MTLIGGILFTVGAYVLLGVYLKPVADGEPDLYFQLAMARQVADHGMVTRLPQAENLHWDEQFPDKNLLYDLLTGVFYKIGGEPLTRALPLILGSLFLTLLFWQVNQIGRRPWVTLGSMFILFLTPVFVLRIILMRPHLLALIFFSTALWALLSRRPKWLAAAGALFALSYHAIYMPLLLIGFGFFLLPGGEKRDLKLYRWGMLGVLAGTFLNPAFPGNLWFGYINARIALDSSQSLNLLAEELKRLTALQFLKMYGAYLLLIMTALASWNRFDSSLGRNTGRRSQLRFLTALALCFWVMTAISPRTLEYAAIVSVFLMGVVPDFIPRPRFAIGLGWALMLVAVTPYAYQYYSARPDTPGEPARMLDAVDRIPRAPASAKVFNCEWVSSPYVLYRRPDLRFVDLWGPYLLYWVDPAAYRLRERIVAGESAYPYGAIQGFFHSQYVLCLDHRFVNQMESDPNFVRLYPETGNVDDYRATGFPFLYQLKSEPDRHFIRDFEVKVNNDSHWEALEFGKTGIRTAYLDFNHWLHFLPPDRRLSYFSAIQEPCLKIRPTEESRRPLEGNTYVGVGGGPSIRIRWNGAKLYESKSRVGFYRAIQTLVKLPHPLRKSDVVEVEVCPAHQGPFGLGISFWNRADLETICRGRSTLSSVTDAPYSDGPDTTCLASFAAKR